MHLNTFFLTFLLSIFTFFKTHYYMQIELFFSSFVPLRLVRIFRVFLEIQTSEWYKVSFNLSNDALFELIAPRVA